MSSHIGINPFSGESRYYNEITKRSVNIQTITVQHHDIDEVELLFKEIKLKSNGILGCACICLHEFYGNRIRKKFIEEGLKCGFKNVEIINIYTAFFLNAVSQLTFKPVKSNLIWIISGNNLYVWQLNDGRATFIGCWEAECAIYANALLDMLKKTKLNKVPDILFSAYKDYENFIVGHFSACKFFLYDGENFVIKGSLLKAQITADKGNAGYIIILDFLYQPITLTVKEKSLISYPSGQRLPITYSQKLSKLDELEIKFEYRTSKHYKLPPYNEIYFTFKMDKNEIYSIHFDEKPNVDVLRTDTIKLAKQPSAEKVSATIAPPLLASADTKQSPLQTSNDTKHYKIPKTMIPLKTNINAIGIDLGTSRCCAAVIRRNGITTVPLDNTGERLLPSYVAYDEKNVKCGKIVVNRLKHHSKSTVFDSKRIMGRVFEDIEIDENWNFCVNSENDKVFLEVTGFNERKKLLATEVAAELLKFVKKRSEEFQGKALSKAVITVPAAFTETQKIATMEAAKLAKWDKIVLLPEPIAAAFAYFVDRPIANDSTVLLFDLGGGTLDVCIFKIVNDEVQVISHTGDLKLGGRNFDNVLINYFKNILLTKYGILTLTGTKYKLMLECQRIKEDFSSMMESSLDVGDFDMTQEGTISISRKEFQRLSQILLNKIRNTIHAALFEANYKAGKINKVLLVGGGSRMRMIQFLLQEIFPLAEHCCEEHPDEVVAIGAAYHAYNKFLA